MRLDVKCVFNKIFVLDVPGRPGDSPSGIELYTWLERRAYQSGIPCKYIEITSKEVLTNELGKIADAAEREGIFPFIHFEAHGSMTGMELGPNEFIKWEFLLNLTRHINVAVRNNLALSFAVCSAGFIYPEIDIFEPAPFFGFVGSIQELDFGPMEVGYNTFFDNMLTSNNFNKALEVLNKDYDQEMVLLGRKPAHNLMFEFMLSEKLFEDLFLSVEKAWEEDREGRINIQIEQAMQDASLSQGYTRETMRHALEQFNTKEIRLEMKREARRVFMMEV